MQAVRPTKYALGVVLFAVVLSGTSATQAEESGQGLSESAVLAIQDNSAKIKAHMEAMSPVPMMRSMALLNLRCEFGNQPTYGASAVNHVIRNKGR